MWIVGVALTRRDTFIVLALLIVMLSPLVILRAWNDTFPSVNIAVIAVARAAGIASGEAAGAPLRKIAEFELPGPAGKRFDYLTIDAGVRRGISRAAPDWQFTIGLTFGFSLPTWSRQ